MGCDIEFRVSQDLHMAPDLSVLEMHMGVTEGLLGNPLHQALDAPGLRI